MKLKVADPDRLMEDYRKAIREMAWEFRED